MFEVSFTCKAGSLPCVEISNSSARAVISLYGAHLLSYIPAGGEEVLMVSRDTNYVYGKAIRGGIPLCWPWFSAHPYDKNLPAHGFVRIHSWALENIENRTLADGTENTVLTLVLPRVAYSCNFDIAEVDLHLIVEVGCKLKVSLVTENLSDKDFAYSCALHTYFNISDIARISLDGLAGEEYFDSLTQSSGRGSDGITFSEEYDRVFFSVNTCVITDPGMARKIVIAKENSGTTVVWNPWVAKSAKMSDFGDSEYRNMLCVETACARGDSRILQPGEKSIHSTIISVEY